MSILRAFGAVTLPVCALFFACGNSGDGAWSAARGGAGGSDGSAGSAGSSTKEISPPITAPPGQIVLRVESARQIPSEPLVLLLTLANGVGGKPIPLTTSFFRLKTSDGILHTPRSSVPSQAWFGPVKEPDSGQELAAGASYPAWTIAFSGVDAYETKPIELTFTVPGVSAGDASVGDGRSATAPVVFEACQKCESICTYLSDDRENCGKCGSYVSDGKCQAGVPMCASGLSLCPSSDGDFGCEDLTKDSNNCGECGREIPQNGSCNAGKPGCPEGLKLCGQACVDVSRHPEHCGDCNVKVPEDGGCNEGKPTCSTQGYSACGSECVALTGDAANCGACGRVCPEGFTCENGIACTAQINETKYSKTLTCAAVCATKKAECTGGDVSYSGSMCSWSPVECDETVASSIESGCTLRDGPFPFSTLMCDCQVTFE